jgi:sugar phosphate isomerase/epimerase
MEGIALAGFKYIEPCAVRGWTEHLMPEMHDDEIAWRLERLVEYDLKIAGLSGHCNLTDKDRLEDFKKNIILASRMSIPNMITSTGEAHFGEEEVVADDVLVENIGTLLPLLERYGITMTLETHGEYGLGEQLYRVTQRVGSPLVGINYDTANVVFYGGVSPIDDIKTCVGDVKYVHLKDKVGMDNSWNLPAVGKGELPLAEFMDYMDEQGYDGVYSVEVEYTEDYCMRDKDQPGDLDIANQAAKDAYDWLKSVGRV